MKYGKGGRRERRNEKWKKGKEKWKGEEGKGDDVNIGREKGKMEKKEEKARGMERET